MGGIDLVILRTGAQLNQQTRPPCDIRVFFGSGFANNTKKKVIDGHLNSLNKLLLTILLPIAPPPVMRTAKFSLSRRCRLFIGVRILSNLKINA